MVLSPMLEMWAAGMERRGVGIKGYHSLLATFFSVLSGCLTLLISFYLTCRLHHYFAGLVFLFPISYLGMPQEAGFSILHPHVFVSEFTPLGISSKFCGLTIVCILMALKIVYNKDLSCRFLNYSILDLQLYI